MTITLEAIRAAGGIVHSDGNIFFRDISMLQGLAGAAPAAVSPWPQGEYPPINTKDFGSDSDLWCYIDAWHHAAPGEASGEKCQWLESHIQRLMRAYFDLGRQPAAAPALEAPATPAEVEKLDAAAMPAQLSAIAAQAALDAKERHSYLPNTSAEAATWRPHFWVIQAMRAAIKFDRAINRAAAPQAPAATGSAITDAQVDAYLTTQRRSVEQADRLPMGITPTNAVREACRQGLLAAIGAAPAAPAVDAAVVWPKMRDVGRIGDMSPSAHLRIGLDSDNDVYASIYDERGGGSIEFCTPGAGGGKSSRTRKAMIALMVAMEADNAADPRRDWWAERNGAAQAQQTGQ